MTVTKIFYHTDFENHIPTLNNPECSKRVANIIKLIKEENFTNISFVEPNKIKPDEKAPRIKYFKPASVENAEFLLKAAKT